jgi:gas vesicle protein
LELNPILRIKMFTFILGMFVGALLGTLAVALCVAADKK